MSPLPASAPGLSSEEAARLLDEHGPNSPPRSRPRGPVRRVGDQLRDPMILLLLGAFVVVTALGDTADAIIIVAVVVLNTAIGVTQEVRAENAIEALDKLAAPRTTVVRDGHPVTIDAALLVPRDLVRLEAGDVVPADGVLEEAVALQLDESAMTGESVPVVRTTGDEVLSGTVVTRGRGYARVTRTGAESGLGRIAVLIAEGGRRPTPLQQRLTSLSRLLVMLTMGLVALVFVLGVLRGEDVAGMLILAVSLAVAAIPESLPAVVSVALALGARRMAKRGALVRWLPAVETLGSVTVLASDKTGTLTEGRMVAQRLWTADGVVDATDPGEAGPVGLLLRDVVLCNDAHLRRHDGAWTVVGDPMEGAMLLAAAHGGVTAGTVRDEWTRVAEIPFDSERQRMTTLDRSSTGQWLVVCKGAPEVVLGLTAAGAGTEGARDAAYTLAEEGFRVLAVAEAVHDRRPDAGDLERGLVPLGLVAIADPPRESAAGVIADCRAAGIRTVLITGDHPATARAIAGELGITAVTPDVVEGAMVERGEHVARVEHIGVYARTKPEQKVDIVTAWQERGHVVAMTGDGVNDAPALRRADIGVAMGDRGTEVARQAADLVLADDDLRTVVVAVGEGRRIFTNIRMFLRYGISGGLAEVAVILAAPFLGMPVPLAPAQILWINMLTHGIPGVAFGAEPMDPAVMSRPSPSPEQSVLGQGLFRQILVTATLIATVSLAAGLLADRSGEHVQSWVFVTLGLAQLGVALALRAPRHGLDLRSRSLEAAVLVAAALQVLGTSWAPLRSLLGTEPVAAGDLLVLVALATLPGLLIVGQRLLARARVGT